MQVAGGNFTRQRPATHSLADLRHLTLQPAAAAASACRGELGSPAVATTCCITAWALQHQVLARMGSRPLEAGAFAWGPLPTAHLQSWQAPMVLPGGQVKHVAVACARRSCPSAVWGHGEQPRDWLELLCCKPDRL